MAKQNFYQKAGVQASFIVGVFALVAAVGGAIATGFFKKSESPMVAVATPVIASPTVQVQPFMSIAPTPAVIPSPLPQATVKNAARQVSVPQTTAALGTKTKAALADLSEREARLKEREQALNAERDAQLNGYIDKYLTLYSQIDLGDAPCDPAAIQEKRKAEALLDLIEALAKEVRRKDILDNFVRDRRPMSIRFPNCS
jgi:hypothetical protein